MERADIIRGIKAALDRGFSIEKIIKSYVKAGYNKEDVIDSAKRVASELGIELPTSIVRAKPTIKPEFKLQPKLIIKPKLPPGMQRLVRPIPLKRLPPRPIKPKVYFPEEAPSESLQQISKYAPPKIKREIKEAPVREIREEQSTDGKIQKEEKVLKTKEPVRRKGVTALFVLLIICASLLLVSLILLLIFKTNVIEFLNNLSV